MAVKRKTAPVFVYGCRSSLLSCVIVLTPEGQDQMCPFDSKVYRQVIRNKIGEEWIYKNSI